MKSFKISLRSLMVHQRQSPSYGALFLVLFMTPVLFGKDVVDPKKEAISKEAVQATQKTLRDEKSRAEIIEKSKAAQQNDQKTAEIAGSAENKEKIYDVSADIMANFEGKSMDEMEAILKQASKDPAGFMKSLTPEQQAKIKEISRQIEASKKNP